MEFPLQNTNPSPIKVYCQFFQHKKELKSIIYIVFFLFLQFLFFENTAKRTWKELQNVAVVAILQNVAEMIDI